MKAIRNKGKSPYGIAVNTYTLQTHYHPECPSLCKREGTFKLQSLTSPNTLGGAGAPLQRQAEKQTGTTHWMQAGALLCAPIKMPTTHGQWKRLSALLCQPVCKRGKISANVTLQVLEGNCSRKKNFVLLDWENSRCQTGSPPLHPSFSSPPAPREWITAPFPRTLKGRWISISTAPAHSCHLQFSSLFTLKSHTISPCLLLQDSRCSLLSSTFRQHPVLPAQTILGSHCFCHRTPN